jgi:pimeloyl-ACP methyl ester carboxylesterase
MNSKIVQLQQGKIEYTLWREGPVVLNLHGGHSNCQENFGYQPLLDAGYSILTPSRPGYGRTDVKVGKTAAETAKALVELLDYNVGKIIFNPKIQKITEFSRESLAYVNGRG